MANPLYFIETTGEHVRGAWFLELDRDTNSRKHVIGLIRTGEAKPVKVLEVNEDEGTVRDVTADILAECDALNYGHAMQSAGDLVMGALFQANDRQAAAWDRARDYRKVEA